MPMVNKLLINYKKPSSRTCASVNKNNKGPSHNKVNKVFKSYLNYFSLYPLVRVIVNILYRAVKAASLVKLCLPEPP